MTRPQRHFSDDPDALHVRFEPRSLAAGTPATRPTDGSVVTIAGSGFVTKAMVDASLAQFRAPGSTPARALIDLRNVSGYEASCVERAREWLLRARREGTERIAFVAESAVIRTVTEMASQGVGVPLRTFATVEAAREWLCSAATPLVLEHHRPRTRLRP